MFSEEDSKVNEIKDEGISEPAADETIAAEETNDVVNEDEPKPESKDEVETDSNE